MRKASTSDICIFLLDDRNAGHQIALLPCHMLVGHLDATRRRRSDHFVHLSTVFLPFQSTVKQHLFNPNRLFSSRPKVRRSLLQFQASCLREPCLTGGSVPPRRHDTNFLAMIEIFCALLGGKIDSIESLLNYVRWPTRATPEHFLK